MEGQREKERAGKTVRFRIASANSGRVLAEVFKEERQGWCTSSSMSGSFDSDRTSSPEVEHNGSMQPSVSEANSHLNGLLAEKKTDESGCEPDELLLYASAKREMLFSNKRINICSKNGTVRGVCNKVSAGQVLFNNLSNMYSGAHRHQKRRPWEH
ncbi:glutaredoxin domain-containing cysteine-rich protein 1 [Gouania willdenowi]|uniref:glutaredoxin domain-containing cysteine-rich protein 1 n=1 Tax=Gouania willdenowi TaxID=441366 RepID=UPI0010563F3C|nr:glutaredoxin domain-containing cysteine-rich protein 1-like [Gouania willdenowi]